MFLKKMQSRQSPNKPPIFLWVLSFAFIKVHFKHHLINRDPQRPYWTYLCSFAPELSQSCSQMPEICNPCRKNIMIYDKKYIICAIRAVREGPLWTRCLIAFVFYQVYNRSLLWFCEIKFDYYIFSFVPQSSTGEYLLDTTLYVNSKWYPTVTLQVKCTITQFLHVKNNSRYKSNC